MTALGLRSSHTGYVNFTRPPSPAEDSWRFHRGCFIAAVAITLLWACVYLRFQRTGLIDEPGQMGVIYHFFRGQPGFPADLPNLPGYHFLALALTLGHPTLTTVRLVTVATALLAVFAFAGGWQRLHGKPAGGPTLLFALFPVMQPFTAMVYTDVPAVAFLCAAFWAHFAGRSWWSAGLFLCACLMRQTCLVWVAYVVAWDTLEAFFPRPIPGAGLARRRPVRAAFAETWRRARWLIGLLGIAAAVILYAGRLTLGMAHGNKPEPNLATLHFGGFLLVLLVLPWMARHAGEAINMLGRMLRERPIVAVSLALAGGALVAKLGATFANPHPWNRELYWLEAPSTFFMVRNWPLVWAERLPWLRYVSALLIVTSAIVIAWVFARQRFRRELWLSVPFGLLLLLTNDLVEPRYFITPFVVMLMLLEYSPGLLRWQIRWFAALCLFHAPFIMDGLSLW